MDLNGAALTFRHLDQIADMIEVTGQPVEVVNIAPDPDPPPTALLFRGVTDVNAFRNICEQRRIIPSLKKFAADVPSGSTPL